MFRKAFNPPALFDSRQYGFSQIVVAEPGRMVFVSGQVAWDDQQQIGGELDLASQTEKAIQNLAIALESVQATLSNVVMLRIYKVQLQQEDGPIISALLLKYFGEENPPASTWLSVEGLANPDFLIEIEAQAVLP